MILYLNFLVFSLTLALGATQSDNYGRCTTPDGYTGSCVMLNNCPKIEKLIDKTSLSKTEEQFLAESECLDIQIENEVIVCCESPATRQGRTRDYHSTSTPKTATRMTYSTRPTKSSVTKWTTTSSTTTSSTILTELPEPGNCGKQKPLGRIVGGEETDIDSYRWMALLIYTRGHLKRFGCGGSLINNRYVLTAAHCTNTIRRQQKTFNLTLVRLGEWDTSTEVDEQNDIVADRAVDVRIEKKILYRNNDDSIQNSYHDIALLRLERYISYTDFIQPICIHRNDDLLNVDISRIPMFASGWGVTENGTVSDIKRHIVLNGETLEQCQTKYSSSRIVLRDTQLCAGGKNGMDTCNGDSGGPLVLYDSDSFPMHYHIVGIISFGPTPCGQPGFPGVYTKVNSYIDWIESNLEV